MNGVGEKEIIAALHHNVLGSSGYGFRNDCIDAPITDGISIIYSIDRPAFIFGYDHVDATRKNGRWAAAVVANDVIACGAAPRGISFDVGLSSVPVDSIEEWARGVLDVCSRYGMKYEGGNLSEGSFVSGIAWASIPTDRIIRRNGAYAGCSIVVTAEVGFGWAARLWSRYRPDEAVRFSSFHTYKDKPWVNLDAFRDVWSLGCIRAGMDLTDGLTEFGYEIAEQQPGLGVVFTPPPRSQREICSVADELPLPVDAFLFEPGYDTPFAHGWCVDAGAEDQVTEILRSHGVPHLWVGKITDDPGVFVRLRSGRLVTLPRYWDDVVVHRGSIDVWTEQILPLFVAE